MRKSLTVQFIQCAVTNKIEKKLSLQLLFSVLKQQHKLLTVIKTLLS